MQIIINGLVAGSLYGLIALGVSIIFRVTRTFDFSVAGTITIAAYAAKMINTYSSVNVLVATLCACGAGLSTAAVTELLIFRPFRKSSVSPLVLLLVSLGVMAIQINLVALLFGDRPQTFGRVVRIDTLDMIVGRITAVQLAALVLLAGASIGTLVISSFTRWGLKVRAVANDRELAWCFGVAPYPIILQATLIGSTIIALAAVLSAMDTGISPVLGYQLLLPGFVGSIVGGIGRPGGAALGGVLIGLVQQTAGWFVATAWQDATLFVVLLAFLLFRPEGLFGRSVRRLLA